jgi:putative heme iron utilization protein
MSNDRILSPADVDRIVAHMNDEHADDLIRYAQVYSDVTDAEAARMTSIDAEGLDLAVTVDGTKTAVRIDFETPLQTVDEARSALVDLAMRARDAAER